MDSQKANLLMKPANPLTVFPWATVGYETMDSQRGMYHWVDYIISYPTSVVTIHLLIGTFCHKVSHSPTWCHMVPYYSILHYVGPHCAMSCGVTLWYVVLYCAILCHAVLCWATLCHVVVCCAIFCHVTHVVPHSVCYVVLYCATLCHVGLCWAMLRHKRVAYRSAGT